MFYQILRLLILLWIAYIYPGTIERITYYFLILCNQLLDEVSCVEKFILGDFCQGTLLDEIDACISIVVILWLLDQTLDLTSIEVEDAVWDADIVWYSSYRHLGIVLLEVEEEVLIVDVGEEIRVHHQDGIVVEGIHELDAADGAQELWLAESAHLHSIARFGIMLLNLLAEVVDGHIEVIDAV